ncbi:MAG TPA: DOMON-like domain-containing protein [Povalibacter sp.]|nr:DOMON-like domain-containing protein [Povalibacter sp.]
MATFTLLPHPATPCPFVTGLSVVVERLQDGGLRCSYEVAGQVDRLDIPQLKSATRTDGLWRHTCFEIFLRTAGRPDYDEFNFSPSREWAAYRFEHYRTGMVELELAEPPVIDYRQEPDLLELHARIGASERPSASLQIGLSVVLRSRDGNVSYWALRHASDKPDFHHDGGYVDWK